jgi:hypothetical protein
MKGIFIYIKHYTLRLMLSAQYSSSLKKKSSCDG